MLERSLKNYNSTRPFNLEKWDFKEVQRNDAWMRSPGMEHQNEERKERGKKEE